MRMRQAACSITKAQNTCAIAQSAARGFLCTLWLFRIRVNERAGERARDMLGNGPKLLKLSTAGASQRVEDAFRRKRLMPYFGSERLQGIIDSDPHRSHRADQAGFADALSAESGR